ncbi:MAG: hypothetical protein KAU14_04810 [Thermoplasmata archaeon]|nr:hypothetical protein [Thermoplasmata archaeon]
MVTLHGARNVKVTVLGCEIHKEESISIPEGIDAPLIPNCRADLKVTILIGLLRWRLGMKLDQVWFYFWTKGIEISETAISYRSLDFLLLFKELHKSKKGKIKAFFDRKGGSILHVDGTHKYGGRVIFVLQEEFADIVTDSELIPSEASEHIDPLLLEFKEAFGPPLVTVRDGGPGVALSCSNIFPETPQALCHPHFIRDLEKDLVTTYHKSLKSSIVKHKLTSKLRGLRYSGSELNKIGGLEQRWIHIAVDYLLYPIEKRFKWLSRPIAYLIQYRRIKEIYGYVRRIIIFNASNNRFYKPIMDLNTSLRSILEDKNVLNSYCLIERTLRWLDELREELHVSRKGHLKDKPSKKIDIEKVKEDVTNILKKIRREGRELGGKYIKIASEIDKAFEDHWSELFVPDPVVNGKKISFKRHNNALESSHRRTRKAIRKRTGRAETNKEMEQFGDLFAILSNLWNPIYQDEILDDEVDLCEALSHLINDLPRLRKEYREARRGPEVQIHDDKRIKILDTFVKTLESDYLKDSLISTLQTILGVTDEIAVVF